MAHSRASRFRIQAARHGLRALGLRESGYTYAQIADELGVSEQRAWQLVNRELDRLNAKRAEKASDVQRLEIARLDAMLKGIWDKAQDGDFAAIDRVLSIMQRRAKLLGLDLADRQAATTGIVVLNVQEVVIERQEPINGQFRSETDTTASGPAALPPQ
jgi:orotate phosphoribosyltransferase-like protein